uniref:Fringe-like glycosyltransferase domain-containing protein n=1 Tax=Timema cristinae TaxID=61476 RepID=A0A7R9CY86_TIMCR|nr:unnamed protein product [Timema cristinae]
MCRQDSKTRPDATNLAKSPDRDRTTIDIPVIGGPVYCESDTLDYATTEQGPRDLVFVVLSQEESSHLQTRAHILRQDLQEQARALEQVSSWTILPVLPRLNSLHGANSSWVIFCESNTKFNLDDIACFTQQVGVFSRQRSECSRDKCQSVLETKVSLFSRQRTESSQAKGRSVIETKVREFLRQMSESSQAKGQIVLKPKVGEFSRQRSESSQAKGRSVIETKVGEFSRQRSESSRDKGRRVLETKVGEFSRQTSESSQAKGRSVIETKVREFLRLKELWLGHGLWDREATIVHHFASLQHFKYPHIASGVVFSAAILQRLSSRLEDETPPKTDFSIDPSHELSLYVWNKGRGTALSHSDLLCLHKQPHCASYVVPFQPCADPVPNRSIYFAVKTCGKFHKDRIPVVKSTWAKYARYIGFYSELEDNSIPTINVGVANTDHGHCGKTLAILSHVAGLSGGLPDVRWVVVADDDTILSLVLVRKLVDSGLCRCPSISTPDDMFLGVCLARLGAPITHSPLFHQARPVDYAPEYLTVHDPVSFHKHWMIDPVGVYQDWFAEFDRRSELEVDQHKHLEL